MCPPASTADVPECLAVGFVVGTDGDGKRRTVVWVELEHEAIPLVEAHGVEVVGRVELLVPSPRGEIAGVQLVEHGRKFPLHRLRESLSAFPEAPAGVVELANRCGAPIRQEPLPDRPPT